MVPVPVLDAAAMRPPTFARASTFYVIRSSRKKTAGWSPNRRFVTLAADMDKTSEPTTEQFHEWRAHKLMIDHDEPPPFHALYILCKNEVLVAMDTEEAKRFVVRIPFWRRWAAQFFKQPEYQG